MMINYSRLTAFLLLFFTLPALTFAQETEVKLNDLIPDSFEQWLPQGEDQNYDRKTIFKYMNGAGEVYRSYDYRQMAVRYFELAGEENVVVELYDMGNSHDAYGIFLRNWQGGDAGIGQNSEYGAGYLVFWQDRFLVTVFTFAETDITKAAVLGIGKLIAQNIPKIGSKPEIIDLLPQDNLLENSIKYFHLYTDLNQHYFMADDNILFLSSETEVVIAEYDLSDPAPLLIIIKYPDDNSAKAAALNFRKYFLPDTDSNVSEMSKDIWVAADRQDNYLIIVMETTDAKMPLDYIQQTCLKISKE
jgi:hypothetical protein